MRLSLKSLFLGSLVPFGLLVPGPGPLLGQDSVVAARDSVASIPSSSLPLTPARALDFTVEEGSWISVDISPDGGTLVFDLLGQLYTMPIAGGAATRLTHGQAFNTQPRFSPDGQRIVFVSDRSGGQNLWILTVATGELVQLTRGDDSRYFSPDWAPDGRYIVASKMDGPRSGTPKPWLYHVDGGTGAQLIREPADLKALGVTFSADGRLLWFARRSGDWQYDPILPQYQLAVYDRRTGEMTVMSDRFGSAFRPTLSPDGMLLVYGTRHDSQTGLRVRELESGEERWLAYPVQRDDQETTAALDVLPGMAFTPDSKEVIASYGGGIWRIPLGGGPPVRIPFSAAVSLELGPEVKFEYPVSDEPSFEAHQIRDARPSPDGRQLAFTALNRLYVMSYPEGEPRRLTTGEVGEFGPVWSPDGKSIAYTTWSDDSAGHIWRVPATGGRPKRLTAVPALYQQLAWSPDGERIVAIRAAARDMYESPRLTHGGVGAEFVWLPSAGGAVSLIAPTAGRQAPHFAAAPDRIYAYSAREGLVSFRWDGTDQRTHLKVTGAVLAGSRAPLPASLILMSPKGERALAQIVNDLYVVTVPETGGAAPAISVADPARSAFPARRLTTIGGQFPAWSADGGQVHWSLGNAHFVADIEPIMAAGPAGVKAAPAEHRIRVGVRRDMPEGVAVLRGARVITMRGDEVIEDADIVVDGNRIVGIGRRGTVTVPAGAQVIDVTGKTIVPGFVDIHFHAQTVIPGVHSSQVWQFVTALAYGTTTVRDPQTVTTDMLTYADRVESGELLGPRVYSTGPGFFNTEPVRSYEEAKDLLLRYSRYYDTKTLKMYMSGNRRQRQWIIMAARELGLMPTTEGGMDLGLDLTHLLDGYSGVEHNLPIVGLFSDVATLLARSGTVNTPALVVSYGGPFGMNYLFTQGGVHDDAKLRHFFPHVELDMRTRRRGQGGRSSYGPAGWAMEDEYIFRQHAEFAKRVVDAGGRIGVGSHGELQGLGYHWELQFLASGGMTPHEVLRAATLHSAEAIGLAGDIGSIAPGKLADLVILDRDPLEDIRHTELIRYVMKNGRLYEGATLNEVWPRKRQLPPLPWHGRDPKPAAGAIE